MEDTVQSAGVSASLVPVASPSSSEIATACAPAAQFRDNGLPKTLFINVSTILGISTQKCVHQQSAHSPLDDVCSITLKPGLECFLCLHLDSFTCSIEGRSVGGDNNSSVNNVRCLRAFTDHGSAWEFCSSQAYPATLMAGNVILSKDQAGSGWIASHLK